MKNILIATLGLALFVGTANIYACGNKGNSDSHGSAATMAAGKTISGTACEVSGGCNSASPSVQKTGGKAITKTTEFRRDYEHKTSSILTPQVADNGATPSKQPLAAQAKQAENKRTANLRAQGPNDPVLSGPVDAKSFLQM